MTSRASTGSSGRGPCHWASGTVDTPTQHPTRRAANTPAARMLALGLGLPTTLVYSLAGFRLYATFRSGMDLAIFDQAVRELSHFRAPTSAMKSPGMSLFGDHLHPVIALAAPFCWIWDDARTLIVVQSLAIGLTVAILTLTASRHFPSPRGLVLSGALGLSLATALGVQYGALFDFHEVALGMPIVALVVAALAWTALAVKIIIPALSPNHAWAYAGAVRGIGKQLHTAWVAFVVDHGLTRTITLLALPVVFTCSASPLVLALLPGLASRAVTDNPNYWQIFNHYNLVPATIVSFAALDGLRRLRAHARLLTSDWRLKASGPYWPHDRPPPVVRRADHR